ncbi:B12-binding domain-containing radical SAM protein [Candidatus Aerophobetes bacterium]|nr:B12-binding domain-containing radical SAM protein [Candidatus Aerophobetes bacterium]
MKIELIRVTHKKVKPWQVFLRTLTLPLLAALTPSDIEVKITDERTQSINYETDADLIGLTYLTVDALRAYKVADEFRKRGKFVVMGGPHASILPEEAIQHADSVVIGEAELVWRKLLFDFQKGTPEKFYQSKTPARMEDIPSPKRNVVKCKGIATIEMVETSRGCPFSCEFCYVPTLFGRGYRLRPIDDVIKDIETLQNEHLSFADDNLVGNPDYAKNLFKKLFPLRKKWFGNFSLPRTNDTELLRLAAKSGCIRMGLGFESVSQKSLEGMNKGFNKVKKYEEIVKKIHDEGISIIGYFMFGFDEDDVSIFPQTVEFIEKCAIDRPIFFILTPVPGTKLYQKLLLEGRILDRNWSHADGTHVMFRPKLMTPDELEEGYSSVINKVYALSSITRRWLKTWRCGNPFYNLILNVSAKMELLGKSNH